MLDLGPSRYTPRLVESIVLLGTLAPFEQVPTLLTHFSGVAVGVETVRRLTEALGAAAVALDEADLARLERDLPAAPPGPAVQLLSVDGAMVPLVGGEWAEVKTLAVGTVVAGSVDATPTPDGGAIHTTDLSYCSALAEAERFAWLATVETHRRGTESAGTVCGVTDGARWCQGFLDLHRPDAVRILDFAHAVGYLSQAAQARYPDDALRARTWLLEQRHTLRHSDPDAVLATLAACQAALDADDAAAQVIQTAYAYLAARREQITYAAFAAAGYPIGSGCVESANKLVVEARLKGSGMHWARAHVNPMLGLRTMLCSQRWSERWPLVWQGWRSQARQRTTARRWARLAPGLDADTSMSTPAPLATPASPAPPDTPAQRPKLVVNGKPTADHPWRTTSPFRCAS
ncbi:MAG: ISKra4 family transposase [Vicinamibacterales bacterium]